MRVSPSLSTCWEASAGLGSTSCAPEAGSSEAPHRARGALEGGARARGPPCASATVMPLEKE